MKSLLQLISEITASRKLIWELAKSDFKKRFAGSYFGVVWMFVQPVVTVLIYFMIFQLGFKSVPPFPGVPYVLWLVPGIVPWFYFNEALNAGTSCLQEYHYLVKTVVFNVEVLPVLKLLSCAVVHAIFVMIMTAMFFCYGKLPMPTWIQIIYYSFALSALILGMTFITSAINVFFKDMAQIVSICLQFGMWLTPIMWDPVMFPNRPALLEQVLKINPVFYIVTGFRDSMLATAALSAVMLLIMQIFGNDLIGLFVNEPQVIDLGGRALRITSWFYLFLGTIYVCRGVLNGVGDALFAFINGIVEIAGRIGLPLLLSLIPGMGVWAVWYTAGITWGLAGLSCVLRYRSWTRKQTNRRP